MVWWSQTPLHNGHHALFENNARFLIHFMCYRCASSAVMEFSTRSRVMVLQAALVTTGLRLKRSSTRRVAFASMLAALYVRAHVAELRIALRIALVH